MEELRRQKAAAEIARNAALAALDAERQRPPVTDVEDKLRAQIEEYERLLAEKSAAMAMPLDLAALMEPDETEAEAMRRLAEEFQNLRSLYVGNLEMTDGQKHRFSVMNTKAAQTWMRV